MSSRVAKRLLPMEAKVMDKQRGQYLRPFLKSIFRLYIASDGIYCELACNQDTTSKNVYLNTTLVLVIRPNDLVDRTGQSAVSLRGQSNLRKLQYCRDMSIGSLSSQPEEPGG